MPPDDPQSYSYVIATKWRSALGAYLRGNAQNRFAVIHAATELLRPARILGYRSRGKSSRVGISSFPPEARLNIVHHLDSDGALFKKQFLGVVSWACDPSSIGYGEPRWPSPWNDVADAALEWRSVSIPSSGLLPVQPWTGLRCSTAARVLVTGQPKREMRATTPIGKSCHCSTARDLRQVWWDRRI